MRMRWQLAVYDFNGTLINDALICYDSVKHIFRTLVPHVPPPTFEEYKNEITADFPEFYYAHGVPTHISGNEMNAVRAPYYRARVGEIRLHDGARELLQFCRTAGIPNAIVSASPENVGEMLLQFGVFHLFGAIRAGTRHKEDTLIETLEEFGIKAEDAFYLDDTLSGLTAAKDLGMGTIGFTGGFNSEERISAAKPDFIVSSLHNVIAILQEDTPV